jgi:hypothetical protein
MQQMGPDAALLQQARQAVERPVGGFDGFHSGWVWTICHE